MHYLVTGGCGFIGSHLVERLLAEGHRVTVLDDLSTGKRENIPEAAHVIEGDITTPGIFDDILPQMDGCFHLAAIASVERSQKEWLRTHQVNVSGFVALLDSLVHLRHPIPVVVASSAAVYGESEEMPLKENADCFPCSAYGADKFACELHAKVAIRNHGLPVIALRFFNVYGPRQDPHSPYSGVISIFADRMRKNLPVTVFGDGEQVRDFIYVGDVVTGLADSMNRLCQIPESGGIFNLATGNATSVNALAGVIREVTNSQSSIQHGPARPGDIRVSIGDTARSSEVLGFKAKTPLTEGLRRTLAEAA